MKGIDALEKIRLGDVIKLRGMQDPAWSENELGWVWGIAKHDDVFEIIAVPSGIYDDIHREWCESGTWISSIQPEDEVIIFKPDKVPDKFWAWLALAKLTGDAHAI